MGCGCKSNNGVRKQIVQVNKKGSTPITHTNNQTETVRKQIIIKRPVV